MIKWNEDAEKQMDRARSRVLIASLLSIVLTVVCLCSVTWAWFSIAVSSRPITLEAGTYSADMTVYAASQADGEDGSVAETLTQLLPCKIDGPLYRYTFEKDVLYRVRIDFSDSTGNGYCKMYADELNTVYANMTTDDGIFEFAVQVSDDTAVFLETRWGIYGGETAFEDGDTVELIVPPTPEGAPGGPGDAPSASDHEWDDGVVTTQPTPTTAGIKTYSCPCGATYTESFTVPFCFAVDGTITSFGSEASAITITLIPEGETEAAYTTVVNGNNASYRIPDVATGTYTLKVSKAGHLVDETTVTVLDGDVTVNVTLALGNQGKQFRINSAYLMLSQDINVIYRTTVPDGFTDPRMVFTFGGEDTVVTEYTVDANGRYCYAFPKVNPQKMGDNICATLYATVDGVEVSVCVEEYSVRQYCINQLNKNPDENLKRMISDLLVYGEKTQLYQNYKTDALVTEGLELSPSTFEPLDDSYNKLQLIGTPDANVNFTSASLELSSDMIVLFGITTSDPTPYTFEVTTNGETKVYTTDDLTYRDGKYYLSVDSIKATKFNEVITAVIKKDGEQVGQTLNYSVNTYIQKYQDSSNSVLAELLKAIYNYGESAKLYEQ